MYLPTRYACLAVAGLAATSAASAQESSGISTYGAVLEPGVELTAGPTLATELSRQFSYLGILVDQLLHKSRQGG